MKATRIEFASNNGQTTITAERKQGYVEVRAANVSVDGDVTECFAPNDFTSLYKMSKRIHIAIGEYPSQDAIRRFCEDIHSLMDR